MNIRQTNKPETFVKGQGTIQSAFKIMHEVSKKKKKKNLRTNFLNFSAKFLKHGSKISKILFLFFFINDINEVGNQILNAKFINIKLIYLKMLREIM